MFILMDKMNYIKMKIMKMLRDEQQCRCGMDSDIWLKSVFVRINSRMVENQFLCEFSNEFLNVNIGS